MVDEGRGREGTYAWDKNTSARLCGKNAGGGGGWGGVYVNHCYPRDKTSRIERLNIWFEAESQEMFSGTSASNRIPGFSGEFKNNEDLSARREDSPPAVSVASLHY